MDTTNTHFSPMRTLPAPCQKCSKMPPIYYYDYGNTLPSFKSYTTPEGNDTTIILCNDCAPKEPKHLTCKLCQKNDYKEVFNNVNPYGIIGGFSTVCED